MRTKLISVFGLAAISAAAFSQSVTVGGTVGVYYPSNSTIKNLIGSQFLSYGITPWQGNSAKGGLTPEFDFITGTGNGNRFLLVPVVLAYEKNFTSSYTSGARSGTSLVPYLRASAGVAYFNYDITVPGGAEYSLQRVGSTAGLEAGLKLSNSAKIFAKYNLFSVEQGFNFSGLQLGVVFSMFKL